MKENWIESKDGTRIFSAVWEAEKPRARVHIVHGLAEYSGRYKEFAAHLQSEGYTVTAHDQRGHGKTAAESGLPYGYIGENASFDLLVDDAFEVNQFYSRKYSGLPVILLGHSMGSFIVRRYIELYGHTLKAAVLSGTGGNTKIEGYAGKIFAVFRERKLQQQPDELLHGIVFGGFAEMFSAESSSAWLSRDQETVESYMEDAACGFVPTAQMFRVLFEGIETLNEPRLLANIPKDLPILLLSGSEDPVGKQGKGVFRTARQLDKANVRNVTVQLYEGGRHEMLQETNRQQVFEYIVRWMKKNG